MCLCLSICVSVSLCNYVLWAISLCAGMYMPMCTYLGMPLLSMALSSSLYRLALKCLHYRRLWPGWGQVKLA